MNGNNKASIIAVIVIVVFGYMVFAQKNTTTTTIPAEHAAGPWRYDTFAKCLTEKGVQMYGSVTCATCAKQRKLFGDSMQYVSEIECNPRYPHPQTERCVAKKIDHTPTWILENTDQSEIKRMTSGLQSFEALAEFSGCQFTEDPT